MLRWRIKSALYIDFENVPLPPDAIANWLAWLEDGVFDAAGRRRRFLQKRVYWNSHAERNRSLFQRHGFAPILIGKYSGLKNGADIRMAMDVVEATYTRSEIEEYILLTGDSDFVPVLERLRHKSKRSAIVVTEHRPNIHTTYHHSADILIPSRRLTEAAQYQRSKRRLLSAWLRHASPAKSGDAIIRTHTEPSARAPNPPRPARRSAVAPSTLNPETALETAARNVGRLLVQQPRNYVAQKRIIAELERVQGFKRQGPSAFFGTGSYRNLLKELTRLDPRITVVDQPGGGTGVVYIPPQGSSAESRPAGTGQAVAMSAPLPQPPGASAAEQAGNADAATAPVPISGAEPDSGALPARPTDPTPDTAIDAEPETWLEPSTMKTGEANGGDGAEETAPPIAAAAHGTG